MGAETIRRLWCSAEGAWRCVGAMRRLRSSVGGARRGAETIRRLWRDSAVCATAAACIRLRRRSPR
eukprot:1313866-Pleurochrysis_carterae.AAC.1